MFLVSISARRTGGIGALARAELGKFPSVLQPDSITAAARAADAISARARLGLSFNTLLPDKGYPRAFRLRFDTPLGAPSQAAHHTLPWIERANPEGSLKHGEISVK
jgi:hypothetical protein